MKLRGLAKGVAKSGEMGELGDEERSKTLRLAPCDASITDTTVPLLEPIPLLNTPEAFATRIVNSYRDSAFRQLQMQRKQERSPFYTFNDDSGGETSTTEAGSPASAGADSTVAEAPPESDPIRPDPDPTNQEQDDFRCIRPVAHGFSLHHYVLHDPGQGRSSLPKQNVSIKSSIAYVDWKWDRVSQLVFQPASHYPVKVGDYEICEDFPSRRFDVHGNGHIRSVQTKWRRWKS
ncbi:hypothetical protein BDK51DRAFT_43610 [Blyttiomyces helicus]|uniref:Uncharacterized protein n=1 Tax=Blyttiomyces helicus TaxID=388810 RepID=A0A4P9W9E4_9FUNG|nr:hypothetical protein BDK51DRAFT_43610 [Blyttiomyces helicus]|eukprot:RKO88135.1 hypothetical protein BDK51DRAFT_43610 [Blyttiomyces helicus]